MNCRRTSRKRYLFLNVALIVLAVGCRKGWSVGAAELLIRAPAPEPSEPFVGLRPDADLIFAEEFAAPLNLETWALIDREDGEGNLDYYTPQNARLKDGMFHILTKQDHSHPGLGFTSSELQWRSFSFTYGTIEVRARFPGGVGTWPAIWLLGHDCQVSNLTTSLNTGSCHWPEPGSDEIDVSEILDSKLNLVNQQLHSNGHDDGCHVPTPDVSKSFHTYTLIWKPRLLEWQIDGKATCRLSADYVPSTPMFLMINTAVGTSGNSKGKVDATTMPQTMEVDYVRVAPFASAL